VAAAARRPVLAAHKAAPSVFEEIYERNRRAVAAAAD
jgi:hypothetical protein